MLSLSPLASVVVRYYDALPRRRVERVQAATEMGQKRSANWGEAARRNLFPKKGLR